ncbi:hypothetical protein pEaSNUABM56_00184 [Erwinia phage pEa_SNUABM_56]|uniref:Uncharacterized protein n=1 Tax=Erwinia phage pEp_SNUABM_01 TaxID=2601643 RepID=A0A5J6DAS8_9CAUD|nr:hypothetical protein HWC63_gp218 [Erwinia phage pEp_SNUABM_01]QEQ94960.1 hypothetical protein pEpSNUABM01_134 [Erwinia phage pEp_SNUABM_01]UYL84885.1 hypothetical protein pEaSNUABM55_00112 [Erwinia phage pEa_SNUABM_55]UYL85204.1 hypothetical protein pEaSNUABM56_00184 [Erwinia phage pEa_SNUABM_56]
MAFDSGLSDAGKAYIGENPPLLSLLYDVNCLPEVVVTVQNPARRVTMLTAVVAYALGKGHENPNSLLKPIE